MCRQLKRVGLTIAYVRKCVCLLLIGGGCQGGVELHMLNFTLSLPHMPTHRRTSNSASDDSSSFPPTTTSMSIRTERVVSAAMNSTKPASPHRPSTTTAEHHQSDYQRHCTNKCLTPPSSDLQPRARTQRPRVMPSYSPSSDQSYSPSPPTCPTTPRPARHSECRCTQPARPRSTPSVISHSQAQGLLHHQPSTAEHRQSSYQHHHTNTRLTSLSESHHPRARSPYAII
jgi:hypothetical protein